MAAALRPIGHEDKLSLVDHLTELRRRLLIAAATLVASFAVCFWQNNAILEIVTRPVTAAQNLKDPSKESKDPLEQAARYQQQQAQALRALAPALASVATTLDALGSADNLGEAQRRSIARSSQQLQTASRQVAEAAAAVPLESRRNLVTLGVAEPFTATITIAFYAALLLAMPMLLFQAYAFVLPAFSPGERKVALPLMLMVPVLFIAGAAFGYFVVLDRAIQFLTNFNDDAFDILLQAKDYFRFSVLFIAGVGLLFQIPVGVLAITRMGIFTPRQLAKNRGYVILGIAILAAVATPTPDPFTMSLAMGPLVILFELSVLLARWLDRVKPAGGGRWDFGGEDGEEDRSDGDDPLDDDDDGGGDPLDDDDDGDDPLLDGGFDDLHGGEPLADDDGEPPPDDAGDGATDPVDEESREDLTKLEGPDRKD